MSSETMPILPGATADLGLEELRAPILHGLCLVAVMVAWLWVTAAGSGLEQSLSMTPILPPMIMLATSAMALLTTRLPFRWRCALFLVGFGSLFTLEFLWTGALAWLYCQALVVTVSALLAGPSTSFALAGLLTLFSLATVTAQAPVMPIMTTATPLGLLWTTAAVSWLSSRNLYTVLHWAMESQARAWQTTNEVTRRREQLRRTLDSLRNAHAALERTSRDLEAARLEAEEARQVKSRFVANISHELRTPLNIIVGFAEMLCTSPEVYGGFNWPPALREDLLTIWRNAEHLLNMVDDVLDLAQIEAAHLPVMPEPTDLTQLVRETLVTASALLRDSGLDLRVALAAKVPLLNLDRTRIRQVLLNLINNAVRFTERGYIEVGSYLRDQEVVVYVRDTGPGIPADKLETIFEEFEQVDTSIRRPHQGAGLGLAVSRQFIRLHAGRLWAESELDKGSTFFFSLPLPGKKSAVQPLRPRRPGWSQQLEEKPRQAIAVCRDAIAIRLLERHLEGLELLPASSPADAVGLVKQWHPEAAYIIVERPSEVTEAVAAAHELLEAVQPFDLTVVVCSLPTERGASLALGVAELLVKPVTQAEIVAAIKRLTTAPSKVLVVDDEPDMLRLLARVIKREWQQAEVLTATSGEAAVALLPRRPDLILLDLLMPGMSGAEVINILRSNCETASIPVVVITARGPAQDLQALRKGELHIIRNSSLSATELVRLLNLLTKALPPHYLSGATQRLGTAAVAPA